MPLEKFIPAALLIFLLCVFILSIITYKNIEQYKNDIDWINYTNDVIKRIDDINLKVVELPLLRRGYIITEDSSYLNLYNIAEQLAKEEIKDLRNNIIDNTPEEKFVVKIDSLLAENISLIRRSVRLINVNDVETDFQIKLTNKIQRNLEEITGITTLLKNKERQLLNVRNEKAEATNSRIQIFIIVTSIFSFLVIGLALFVSQRLIRNKDIAEQLLIKSHEELEDIVEERTLELKESNEKLSEEINIRKRNEQFLKIQYEVSKTLAESKTVKEASKALLKNICSGIDWNLGILWVLNGKENPVLESIWSDNDDLENSPGIYDKINKFSKYSDLPGSVLKEGKSKWIKNINIDENFFGKEVMEKLLWNSGLGIPISNGKDIIAIVECFNKKNIEEKQDLIDVLESAGRQIGNFIERKKAEENLRVSYLELEEKVKERTSELAATLSKLIREGEEKEIIQNKIKLFSHAIRSIKDCVYITDLNNKVMFVNQAFELTYGYSSDELLGKEIPILQNVNLTPNLKKDIQSKTLKDGWKGELITKTKYGSGFYTYLSTSSIRNDEGKVEAIVGICQDITELKNTQEIVKKRNNLLIVLNDVIRFTNKTFDFNEAVRYSINKVCEYTHCEIGHYFFKRNEELVSTGIWNDNLSENYFPFKNISDHIFFRNGEGFPGKAMKTRNASWINIQDLSNPRLYLRSEVTSELGLNTGIWVPVIMENEVIGILEFFKKEKAEFDQEVLDCIINIGLELGSRCEKLDHIEKIKQSEKLLLDAQHIAKLGSWEWDVLNNKVSWSDEMYLIFGIDKGDSELSYENYIELIHPGDVERSKAMIAEAIANKSSFSFFHRIITPEGKIKIIKAQGQTYLDEEGRVERMFGTGHDVTELREAEEELKKTNTKLIETQKELIYTEKLAALGRFSSGIAHEIRNPLANISSLAQLIAKANIDEKNKRRLNYIITNVEIANKIIKNLLNYASPGDLDFEHVNINEILNSILESVEARCKNNNIKIVREIPPDLQLLYLDKLKLENAFMNFVSNSIEAMYDGGTLTIKVTEDKQANIIRIIFTDTGEGIPRENLDKILEPFFTTKDQGVGLGMGLAYQTIKLHHGVFNIDSTEGEGTQIEITLPIRKINSEINGKDSNR